MNRTVVKPGNMAVHASLAQLLSAVMRNRALLCLALCLLGLSSIASAQGPRIISFDAPGADTKPGDFNGTYAMSINLWGAVTGAYQDSNNTFHGFLRSPRGAFTTFQAPGADNLPLQRNQSQRHQ